VKANFYGHNNLLPPNKGPAKEVSNLKKFNYDNLASKVGNSEI
jgi:hypothetical protein